ncbi:hypothetical protein GXM21_06950 [Megamonas funiformis]|mgnify:FL=1|jgi:hypothetical protein|uniref:Uncharacterized protein n=1 Tax=Megamonas funiformis YIT 11815 TaxID=742816 RepID=A0ABP2NLS8_9FIRM|nr:hypothetical protein [Megamonas funiformis]UVX48461.1 MAG: putative periplasmic lipoprotein [Bacteriophage sp.]EHR38726.1 hypothetical protein HMPREF9454_00531 [Megamonas funiformis YIT 11815]QIB60139.1 hypothetical protein GXM21_06950 [Megamonas funiformis]UVY68988.1 MAG: putative periplasmic lipoprotein [Bacteriophage sp.]UWF97078.1 MAG: putative periplasmic lipoprotein [Bacteriophage sp.]
MRKLLLALCCAFFLSTATASANSLHDIQDNIPTDKALHFMAGYVIQDQLQRNVGCSAFEAFLITSAIAWAKEKFVDDHVDNNDAYATMAGGLFYQIKF